MEAGSQAREAALKNIVFLDDETFEAFIQQDKLTLLFFLLGAHLGCRRQIPLIRAFADAHGETYNVAAIDAGKSPVACRACGVDNVPWLVIARRGVVLGGRRGGIDFSDYEHGHGCGCSHGSDRRSDEADLLVRLDGFQKIDMDRRLADCRGEQGSAACAEGAASAR